MRNREAQAAPRAKARGRRCLLHCLGNTNYFCIGSFFFFSLTFSEWGRLKSKTDFCTNQHMGAYHVDMHVVTCAIPATISRLHRCASAMSTSAQCRCHFSTFLFKCLISLFFSASLNKQNNVNTHIHAPVQPCKKKKNNISNAVNEKKGFSSIFVYRSYFVLAFSFRVPPALISYEPLLFLQCL